jgi:hypothetical protein
LNPINAVRPGIIDTTMHASGGERKTSVVNPSPARRPSR